MPWMNVLAGAVLVLFGRKLFWLFVGCVGFIVGFDVAGDVFQGQPEWLLVLVGVGVGLLGAIASVFLERMVVAIAGFFAGGYVLSHAAPGDLQSHLSAFQWVAYAVGGVLGAILTTVLLDPALIILSSLAGATAISQNVPLKESNRGILFLGLLVLGIVVQTMQYAARNKPPKKEGE